jgi:hypothetical protein
VNSSCNKYIINRWWQTKAHDGHSSIQFYSLIRIMNKGDKMAYCWYLRQRQRLHVIIIIQAPQIFSLSGWSFSLLSLVVSCQLDLCSLVTSMMLSRFNFPLIFCLIATRREFCYLMDGSKFNNKCTSVMHMLVNGT